MTVPGEEIDSRLKHPIVGPISISFFVWNWPILVWFAGGVAKPAESVAGIANYISSTSWHWLFLAPLTSGLIYAFGAPVLISTIYTKFELWQRRLILVAEGRSKKLDPISGKHFDRLMAHSIRQRDALKTLSENLIQLRGEILQKIHTTRNNIRHFNAPLVDNARENLSQLEEDSHKIQQHALFATSEATAEDLGDLESIAKERIWYKA